MIDNYQKPITTKTITNTTGATTGAAQIEKKGSIGVLVKDFTDKQKAQFIEDLCWLVRHPGDVNLLKATVQEIILEKWRDHIAHVSAPSDLFLSLDTLPAILNSPLTNIYSLYCEVLASEWPTLPKNTLLCLADVVLHNQSHFSETVIQHAAQYLVENSSRLFNAGNEVLADFLHSGKLPKGDSWLPKNLKLSLLLEQFYSLMFVENEHSSSTNRPQIDVAYYCSLIIPHLELCSSNTWQGSLLRGLYKELAKGFKGASIEVWEHSSKGVDDTTFWEHIIAKSLTNNPNLIRLNCGNSTGSYIEQLMDNSTVTDLSLNCCNYEMNRIKLLAAVFETNSTLKRVALQDYWQENDGLKELVTGLRVNSSIEQLNLRCYQENAPSPQYNDSFTDLTNYLMSNCSLNELSLSNFRFQDNDVDALVAALNANTGLDNLMIMGADFPGKQLSTLFTMLINNTTLKGLAIINTDQKELSNDDIASLAKSLNQNSVLESLSLCIDNISGNLDIAAFLDAVGHHPSLSELVLYWPIKVSDAIKLIEQSNLTSLTLGKIVSDSNANEPTVDDRRLLLNAIEKNKRLKDISMPRVFNEVEKRIMNNYLDRNRKS